MRAVEGPFGGEDLAGIESHGSGEVVPGVVSESGMLADGGLVFGELSGRDRGGVRTGGWAGGSSLFRLLSETGGVRSVAKFHNKGRP